MHKNENNKTSMGVYKKKMQNIIAKIKKTKFLLPKETFYN